MQTSLIVCLIIFLVGLILIERIHSIKIIIRFILSLVAVSAYVNAIVDGKSIIGFSILLVFILAVINIYIKNGMHRI